jgi:hypothetical protein
MATSQIQTVRAALQSDIAAQLSGVNVFAYPPGDEALEGVTAYEYVALGAADFDQTHLTFGGSREETFDLDGFIWVRKAGAGDTIAAAAETRAQQLLAGVEAALRADSTISSSAFHGQLTTGTSTPAADSEGRVHGIEFTISIETHI